MDQNKSSVTAPVELTPELRERIRKNRERALQIQAERKRKLQEQQKEKEKTRTNIQEKNKQKQKLERSEQGQETKRLKREGGDETATKKDEEVDCEDWEIELSEWVSKKEAVEKYCLPEGTLAVCEVSTKDNPHNKGWAPMKLYRRSELRNRAYKRYGGKEGLIEERTKREQKRLAKDLKDAEDIFAKK